jgi:glycosyltransferase involved in cell wall biosynthesis
MKILFYQNKRLRKDEVSSDGVHVTEVLNHLYDLGHTIIYASGEYHSIMPPLLDPISVTSSDRESKWLIIKRFVSKSPFRGEAKVIFNFLKEIELFILASRTVLIEKPDLIYRRHTFFASEHILSRIFRIPNIREVNGLLVDEVTIRKEADKFSLWILNDIERRSFQKAAKSIVVTLKLKDTLINEYKIPDNKIVVIENGANTDLFAPMDMSLVKRSLHLSPRNSYVCFVGGLMIWHGIETLVASMPFILDEYPDARVLIVGDGIMKNELVKQSIKLNISDKVIFVGKVPYGKVPWYINASEVGVVCSKWDGINHKVGSSPLKFCEYLACGKPVVSTKLSGQDILEKFDCGYIVNQDDSKGLAQALLKLLRDPLLRERMGQNGRKYVLQNRSWESISKKVADVCSDCIEDYKKIRMNHNNIMKPKKF